MPLLMNAYPPGAKHFNNAFNNRNKANTTEYIEGHKLSYVLLETLASRIDYVHKRKKFEETWLSSYRVNYKLLRVFQQPIFHL